ncbi:MAG TPA: extracellular solute-binding protein, partial [Candidatus Paceibacterota bacterium]
MKNVSVFQIVVLAGFMFIAVAGIAVFAGFGGGTRQAVPKATIWGTVSAQAINELVRNVNIQETVIEVTYVQKAPETFESEFVNALAEGTGPDAVLLTDDLLYAQRNKLEPIPFTVLDERAFRSTFIDGARHFVSPQGILGVPLSVNPLVMYWNKNIFASAGLSQVPKTWADLATFGPSLISRTDASSVIKAMVPMGEYSNVTNAKGVLTTLFFQSGNPLTARNADNGAIYSTLDGNGANAISSPESVVDYYTSFANPSRPLYTWNRSMPRSEDAFLAGNLAMYFGYASELTRLQDKNPNLNFDVALMPQFPEGIPVTYGKLTAFSIVRRAPNQAGALAVISRLTDKASVQIWTDLTNLPAVRNDLLALPAKNAYMSVFNKAAI